MWKDATCRDVVAHPVECMTIFLETEMCLSFFVSLLQSCFSYADIRRACTIWEKGRSKLKFIQFLNKQIVIGKLMFMFGILIFQSYILFILQMLCYRLMSIHND